MNRGCVVDKRKGVYVLVKGYDARAKLDQT